MHCARPVQHCRSALRARIPRVFSEEQNSNTHGADARNIRVQTRPLCVERGRCQGDQADPAFYEGKAKTEPMKNGTDPLLRAGVPAFDATHVQLRLSGVILYHDFSIKTTTSCPWDYPSLIGSAGPIRASYTNPNIYTRQLLSPKYSDSGGEKHLRNDPTGKQCTGRHTVVPSLTRSTPTAPPARLLFRTHHS